MNIMKNPALSGKKNPKRLGSGDSNNEKTMLGIRQAFFILIILGGAKKHISTAPCPGSVKLDFNRRGAPMEESKCTCRSINS